MSMFAVIVSGRLVQTDFQQVDNNKFLFTIPDADSINHLVVFMTGQTPLPPGLGASVYFSWPDPNAPPSWIYLGYISNDKPSAIFKISKLKGLEMETTSGTFDYNQAIVSHVAQIGISVEQMSQIEQMVPESSANPNQQPQESPQDFQTFAAKTAENLFNYVLSFSQSIVANSNEQFIPLATIQQWYESFQRRLQFDPNFWRSK